jgi:DNA-binding response OmpR family regulator
MSSFVTLNDVVVVIAEDDDDVRFALSEFLIQKGATVFACPDARAALEAVRARHPDIVLSDIGLPKRDGFELLRDIRSLDPEQGGSVPVIAVTALEGIGDQTGTVDSGFRAILRKPFKPDRLLSTVVSTLGPDRISTTET